MRNTEKIEVKKIRNLRYAKILTIPKRSLLAFGVSFGVACALFTCIFFVLRQNRLIGFCEIQKVLESELTTLETLQKQISPSGPSANILKQLMYHDVVVPRRAFQMELLGMLKLPKTTPLTLTQFSGGCPIAENTFLNSALKRRVLEASWMKDLLREHDGLKDLWNTRYSVNEPLSQKMSIQADQDAALLCRNRSNRDNMQTVSNLMKQKCQNPKYSCGKFQTKIEMQTRDLATLDKTNTEKFQAKWGNFGIKSPECQSP